MTRQRMVWGSAIAWVLVTGLGVTDVAAQGFRWPDEPENIKVLPDSVTGARLGRVMRSFAGSLGVRCNHCHVGEESKGLESFDFAADDKEEKQIARVMIEMVQAINASHLAKLDDLGRPAGERVAVSCVTCHRGQPRPLMIQDVLAETIARKGIDSAVAQYRELRARFYGGFSYDFRPGPLATLGRSLSLQGKTDEAVRVLELEAEFYPESFSTYATLGGILARGGRRDEAVASLERALKLAPEDRAKGFVQRQLDRLKGS